MNMRNEWKNTRPSKVRSQARGLFITRLIRQALSFRKKLSFYGSSTELPQKLPIYDLHVTFLNSDTLWIKQTYTCRKLIKDRQNSLSPSKIVNSRLMGAGDIGSTTDDSSSAIRTVISNHPPTAHALTPNRHTPYSSPTPRLIYFWNLWLFGQFFIWS